MRGRGGAEPGGGIRSRTRDTSRPLPGARLKRAKKGRRDVLSAPVLTHSVGVPQFFEASVSGSDGHPTVSRPYPASSPAVGPAHRRGPFKSLAGRQPEVAVFPGRRRPPSTCSRAALPAMQALRASLTLALGAGLGAAAESWRRRREDARVAPGLLGRLPVLPVAAAAELPAVPAKPGAPAGAGQLAKYGLPGLAQLKSRESYVLCYDPRTRGALWVVEQLRPERLRGDGDRRSCDFREDESVHAYHRATNADYRGSGFDRGHLAAAANHRWSQKAVEDTFYLSNVAPQVAPALRVRRLAAHPARPWREAPSTEPPSTRSAVRP